MILGWLFLVFSFFSGMSVYCWLVPKSRYELDPGRLSCIGLLAFVMLITSAIPLLLIDHWSIPLHFLSLLILSFFPIYRWISKAIRNRIDFQIRQGLAFYLVLLGIGVALQWKGVYYLYLTHDSGVYLNAARHLVRTGQFNHRDRITEIAHQEGGMNLGPLVSTISPSVDWLRPSNYSLLSRDPKQGLSNFHGMFGEQLFLALGTVLFGEAHCIRIHWIYFALSLLLVIAILQLTIKDPGMWPWIGGGLFTISPLIVGIYREPLSEPLVQIFFLGMLFCVLRQNSNERVFSKYLFLSCICASLFCRMSALFYLAFFLFAICLFWNGFGSKMERIRYYAITLVFLLSSIAIVAYTKWPYVSTLLSSDLQFFVMLGKRITSQPMVSIGVGCILSIVGFLSFSQRMRIGLKKYLWPASWFLYAVIFVYSLYFFYNRVFSTWSNQHGGFPFVLYPPDCLIFYGGPIVVILGIAYWFWRAYHDQPRDYIFLQGYFAFCVAYYLLRSFGPYELQIYYLRYLYDPLIFAILGAVIVLAKVYQIKRWRPAVRIAIFLSIVWNATVTYSINHFDSCDNTYQSYQDIDLKIKTYTQLSKNPALVAVAPTWNMLTFLYPLNISFGYPLLVAYYGFTDSEVRGLAALESLGYDPVLIADSTRNKKAYLERNGWVQSETWDHCYRYSKFSFGAPPFELGEQCQTVGVYVKKADHRVFLQ